MESGTGSGTKGMRFKVIVRDKGQITLPQDLRQALGIEKGTVLEVRVEDGRLVLEVIAK